MVQGIGNHYILPVRIVHTGVFALIVSIILNSIEIILHGSLMWGSAHLSSSTGEPVRLPVAPRQVALEVVDSDRYGMHDNNDWASVIPFGHGFVRVGEGGEGGEDDYYAVSMYHQMHCLNSFRRMFNGRNESRAEHDGAHALHCLTYLRQMVLCSADITLEPAFATHNVDGRKTQAAYGTGVTHVCNDWVQVRDWVEANYEEWKDADKEYVATEASAVDD